MPLPKYILFLPLFFIVAAIIGCDQKSEVNTSGRSQNFSAVDYSSSETKDSLIADKKSPDSREPESEKLVIDPVQQAAPFVLTAGVNRLVTNFSNEQVSFRDLGLNTVLVWRYKLLAGVRYANKNNLHWMVNEFGRNLDPALMEKLTNIPGGIGFMLNDEPSRQEMEEVAKYIQELRGQYSDFLFLSNALPSYASTKQLWGNSGNPDYSYEEYLKDYVTILEPDIMMYDHYPFTKRLRLRGSYFSDLMAVRTVAKEHGLPYWGWIQAFEQGGWREPSESDLRMQAFSMLTAGYTGLTYYFYNSTTKTDRRNALVAINEKGQAVATPIYSRAESMNPEILNLAHTLRYLESRAVRFIPGQSKPGQANPPPNGLKPFAPGAGGDPHVTSISVLENGKFKNGLIGFFTDARGQHYFMLTNLFHGANLTAEEAAVTFRIRFDDSVSTISRLNRKTGKPERVELDNHTLTFTLPGGTGDLFKYKTGPFVIGPLIE